MKFRYEKDYGVVDCNCTLFNPNGLKYIKDRVKIPNLQTKNSLESHSNTKNKISLRNPLIKNQCHPETKMKTPERPNFIIQKEESRFTEKQSRLTDKNQDSHLKNKKNTEYSLNVNLKFKQNIHRKDNLKKNTIDQCYSPKFGVNHYPPKNNTQYKGLTKKFSHQVLFSFKPTAIVFNSNLIRMIENDPSTMKQNCPKNNIIPKSSITTMANSDFSKENTYKNVQYRKSQNLNLFSLPTINHRDDCSRNNNKTIEKEKEDIFGLNSLQYRQAESLLGDQGQSCRDFEFSQVVVGYRKVGLNDESQIHNKSKVESLGIDNQI